MSFVTTVTCARNIKGDYPSFFYIRGDFAYEHVARVSDNGDRMRGRIKTEVNTLAKAKPLARCLASGVPAMDCGWENLGRSGDYEHHCAHGEECKYSGQFCVVIRSLRLIVNVSCHQVCHRCVLPRMCNQPITRGIVQVIIKLYTIAELTKIVLQYVSRSGVQFAPVFRFLENGKASIALSRLFKSSFMVRILTSNVFATLTT